jgi:DNA-binding NtrC family response regulator
LERGELATATKILKKKVSEKRLMVGASPSIMAVKETIQKVAATEARILITGENGTGKELVAQAIHDNSDRSKANCVEVNCAAIPSELIESELFGHEKGAFTSAIKQKIGKFEQASGGTLFLDEIGDMDFNVQAKVLRALQEHKITRVGGEKDIKIDVRVISATNKNLEQEIENKRFRLDLYHRLNVINIHLPSLNQRGDDVKLIANHILKEICKDYKIPEKTIDAAALDALKNYQWSGNVRELRNVVERLVILSGKATAITQQDVASYTNPLKLGLGSGTELYSQFNNLSAFKKHSEKNFVKYKLAQNAQNIEKTAAVLEITIDELQKLLID